MPASIGIGVLVATARAPWFAEDTVKMPPEQRAATYDEIGRRLRALPGVTSVARAFTTPIGDDNWFEPVSPGREGTSSQATGTFNFVSPEYFRTLRTPILAGRDFDDRDTKTSAPVAIVNESAARKFFPGVIAIGRHFRKPSQAAPIEIVGIVKDSKYRIPPGSDSSDLLPASGPGANQEPKPRNSSSGRRFRRPH